MDALTALITRVSSPGLDVPGPTQEQLETLLQAAIRAPDHGLLRPWRFLVLEGEDRQRLSDIMEEQLLAQRPDANAMSREKARSKALRAPTIIVAGADITEDHKIPVWEQVVAVGAAVQNMMLAAHAMGMGAMWRTGDLADDNDAKARLGFAPKDQVVAFLYLGTPVGYAKPLPQEEPDRYRLSLP